MQKTGLNSSPNEKKNFTLNEDDAEQNKYNDEMINTFTIELAHTSYLSKKTTLNMWFKIDCLLEKRSF